MIPACWIWFRFRHAYFKIVRNALYTTVLLGKTALLMNVTQALRWSRSSTFHFTPTFAASWSLIDDSRQAGSRSKVTSSPL